MRRPRGRALLAGALVAGVLTTSAGYLTDAGGTHAYFSDTVTVTLHVSTGSSASRTHPTGHETSSHDTREHSTSTRSKPSKSPATEPESTHRASPPPPPTTSDNTSLPESTSATRSESATPRQQPAAHTLSSGPETTR